MKREGCYVRESESAYDKGVGGYTGRIGMSIILLEAIPNKQIEE